MAGRLISIEGAPASGIRIAAIATSAPAGGRTDSAILSFAQTDNAGRYRLEGVPPGSYYIIAGSFEAPSYYPGVHTLSAATTVTVADRAAVDTPDFKFTPPTGIIRIERAPAEITGRFSGVATDGLGRPMPVVTIILTDAQTKTRFITCTDRAGAFEFTGLTAGTFSLEALAAVQTGYYGQQVIQRNPDVGGFEFVTGTLAIRPRETLQAEVRLRQRAPLDSAWQQQPDIYARPTRLIVPGGIAGGGQLRGVQVPTLPYPPGFKGSKAEDSVAIQLLIGADGKLLWLHVVSPNADPDLARAALQELLKWTSFPRAVLANGGSLTSLGILNVYFAP